MKLHDYFYKAITDKPTECLLLENGLSHNYKPGEMVVLVGAPGSGKSTLVSNLMTHFNDNKLTLIQPAYNDTKGYELFSEKDSKVAFWSKTYNFPDPLTYKMFIPHKDYWRKDRALIEIDMLYHYFKTVVDGGFKYMFIDEPEWVLPYDMDKKIGDYINDITKKHNLVTVVNTHSPVIINCSDVGIHIPIHYDYVNLRNEQRKSKNMNCPSGYRDIGGDGLSNEKAKELVDNLNKKYEKL